MAVPRFPAEALNEDDGPLWIDSLADEDPNHLLHVVRGLGPAAAIELVGGRVLRELTPGELPTERPDYWRTPAHAAISAERTTDLRGDRGRIFGVRPLANPVTWRPSWISSPSRPWRAARPPPRRA